MSLFYKPKRLKRDMKKYYRNRQIIAYLLTLSLTSSEVKALDLDSKIEEKLIEDIIEETKNNSTVIEPEEINNIIKQEYLNALKEILLLSLQVKEMELSKEVSVPSEDEISEVTDQETMNMIVVPTEELVDETIAFPEETKLSEQLTETPKYLLDFSNIPVYDGSIEQSIKIAEFIRETVKDIPNNVKEKLVLSHFKLAMSQLDVIVAVFSKEAASENTIGSGVRYNDAFAVTNQLYNRRRSTRWINDTKRVTGKKTITLFDLVTAPGQYEPYIKKTYTSCLGQTSGEVYQAVIDCLFTMALKEENLIADVNVSMHPYLSFRGNSEPYSNSVQFVPRGNKFAVSLTDSDLIPLELRYDSSSQSEEEVEIMKEEILKYTLK